MSSGFQYDQAFSRNLGWVTAQEQQLLRGKCVAIAGLGGVGGSHLLTLTRMGVGAFHLADPDHFELANFNRQVGAALSRLGRSKVEALAEMALDINPELRLQRYPQGVTAANVDEFLTGADIYLDGLDFFALEARPLVFAACARRGIPAVTAAPLGMGVALLVFLPGRMSFENYFRLEGQPPNEQLLRLLVGLSPALLQAKYLADPSRVNLAQHQGPSTPMAVELCAGVAATQVVKILLGRGSVPSAPVGFHFDAYRNRLVKTWRPGGNRNPLQQLALWVARRRLAPTLSTPPVAAPSAQPTAARRILDLARWAPSGDNTQPWRFEMIADRHLVLHGHDTRDQCVYDLDGHPSQIALGALLETLVIAASAEKMRVQWARRAHTPQTQPTFDVELIADATIATDPLLPWVVQRMTQRRPLRAHALTEQEHGALRSALTTGYSLTWQQTGAQRRRVARLLFHSAHIRLTTPEAYRVHRDIIEWHVRYSADRIPDQALGVDPLTTRLMAWALQSWSRVQFMNRWLGGTFLPRVQMDVLPALGCAGHFFLLAPHSPQTLDDFVDAGRCVQRLWLTATSLGLFLQPEMTPLIFASYARQGLRFTTSEPALRRARETAARLDTLLGSESAARLVFMGRVGHGRPPRSRSLRQSLDDLLVPPRGIGS